MTTATLPLVHVALDRRRSTRIALLILGALACLAYAIWYSARPTQASPQDVQADTMCMMSRIGLGGFCGY